MRGWAAPPTLPYPDPCPRVGLPRPPARPHHAAPSGGAWLGPHLAAAGDAISKHSDVHARQQGVQVNQLLVHLLW